MSALLAVNGRLSGFENQPTELTVSQTPTKYGLHGRENVALNAAANLKYSAMRGCGGAPGRVCLLSR